MRPYLENTEELNDFSSEQEVNDFLETFVKEVISDAACVKMLFELYKQYPQL